MLSSANALEILTLPFTSSKRLIQIVFAPWPATIQPIHSLLNAPTETAKDFLTATWRDRKLSELSFVGITVLSQLLPPFHRQIDHAPNHHW